MGVSGFVQGKRARDVDLKRTGLDQTVEFLDLLGTWLDIVVLDFHAGRRFWRRHHTEALNPGAHPSLLRFGLRRGTIRANPLV